MTVYLLVTYYVQNHILHDNNHTVCTQNLDYKFKNKVKFVSFNYSQTYYEFMGLFRTKYICSVPIKFSKLVVKIIQSLIGTK